MAFTRQQGHMVVWKFGLVAALHDGHRLTLARLRDVQEQNKLAEVTAALEAELDPQNSGHYSEADVEDDQDEDDDDAAEGEDAMPSMSLSLDGLPEELVRYGSACGSSC